LSQSSSDNVRSHSMLTCNVFPWLTALSSQALLICIVLPIKSHWFLYVSPGLALKHSSFSPHSTYVFRMDLKTKSDYYLQH